MYKYDKYIHAGLKIEFAGAHKDEMFTADRHVCAYVRARVLFLPYIFRIV